eukprot:TRINITY_DN2839_c0_g2_i1.p1 TRINITY_DN2839_c0_g2~~TRINITY_DN2839_c0_g2_i1.p1  ORF type:complete len:710 (+),score=190.22 TRINITY_DN2839_c0_g2_i1:46-2175(+)
MANPLVPTACPATDHDALMLCVFHPYTLAYLHAVDAVRLREVCRWMAQRCDDEDVWYEISRCLGREHGFYVPHAPPAGFNWAKLVKMMVQGPQWAQKFSRGERQDGFDIRVNVRFRPGTSRKTGVLVPLHQRLMIMQKGETFVAAEPAEFKDALMGSVMADPVRLPSSGRICDRCVIAMHLRRSATDPFDKTPLTAAMLVPCDDLRQRIAVHRAKDVTHDDKRVGEKGMKELARRVGQNVAMDVLEVLAEAERLKALSLRMASKRNKKFRNTPLGDAYGMADSASSDEETADTDDDDDVLGNDDVLDSHAGADASSLPAKKGQQQAGGYSGGEDGRRARDMPRVLDISERKIMMFHPGKGVRPYTFHACYDGGEEAAIYDDAARHAVTAALNGVNSSIMCYGQTGSGKTHTMFGSSIESGAGVALRSLKEVMDGAEDLRATSGLSVSISARYLQIYHNKLFCLLSRAQVKQYVGNDGAVLLKNSVETPLTSYDDVLALLREGELNKRFAETKMNAKSSRSHTVLVVELVQEYRGVEVRSCLNMIDLAGSERVKKSGAASGLQFREAVEINKSLSALGRCITGLVEAAAHIPFHDSKLTLLLKPFLQQGCLASLIVCARRDDEHAWETTQSLGFAESCTAISASARKTARSGTQACLDFVDGAVATCERALQRITDADEQAMLEKALWRMKTRREAFAEAGSTPAPMVAV